MSYANRNSVLRYVAGGSSRGLRGLREMRRRARQHDRRARKSGETGGKLKKFADWIRKQLPSKDRPENHVHPRHERKEKK